jgi:O-antigen/teichoic acid export membrane protein
MTPYEYGIVGFAFGFVSLFQIFGDLGFNSAHIKRISEGKDLGTCNGTFLTVKIGLMGLTAVVVLAVIFSWKFFLGHGFESMTHEMALYIMLCYFVLSVLSTSLVYTFNAKKEIAKAYIPLIFEVSARTIATIVVALNGYGVLALVFTYVVGWVVSFIPTVYFFRGYPIKRPDRGYLKDYSTFAFPLIVVLAGGTILVNIDKVILQMFWSSSDVGYYFAASRLAQFINVVPIAIGTLLFPTFSALHINKNINSIRKLVYDSERHLSMLVFPMVFGMVVLAGPTVSILISGWTPAIPILQILPFFVLFAALEQPYQSQFLGMNQPKLARNRIAIMACLNVFLNMVLIPVDIRSIGLKLAGLGTQGAAIALVVSYAVGLIYSRVMAWRLSQVKGSPRVLLHALAAGIMAALLFCLSSLIPITRWYHLLTFAFIGLGIYLFILYLMREFDRQDLEFFLDTLNIKKMYRYIKEEIRKN